LIYVISVAANLPAVTSGLRTYLSLIFSNTKYIQTRRTIM
jgi:hypothetical protein